VKAVFRTSTYGVRRVDHLMPVWNIGLGLELVEAGALRGMPHVGDLTTLAGSR
jgi:hypothetical protein